VWLFYLVFFGSLNDAVDRKEIKGWFIKIIHSYFYLILFPLILVFINADYWIILASSILQIIFYELTAKGGIKIIKKQQNKYA